MTHVLTDARSKARRWVYILCAGVFLVFAIFSAAEGGIVGATPYVPFIVLCAVQFFKPTLLGWIALAVMFSAYAVAVAAHWRSLTRVDLEIFLLIGLVPVAALLWSRPRRIAGSS